MDVDHCKIDMRGISILSKGQLEIRRPKLLSRAYGRIYAKTATLLLCLALPANLAAEDEPASFGKLSYYIGSSPGGGYDRYGRLVSRYLERYLPGSTVIPENQRTAGGMPALRELLDADPDDAVVMLFNTGLLLSELGGRDGMDFSLGDFNWIGKASSEARFLMVGPRNDIQTLQDLRDAEPGLVFVTGAFGGSAHVLTSLLNTAFNLKLHLVLGFGGSESDSAMIKGEADGVLVSESNVAGMIEAGSRPILAFGDVSSPELQHIPKGDDVAVSPDEILVARLISTMGALGRPTVAPPNMAPEMVAQLRQAYAAALTDPDFLAEAEMQGLPIDFLSGEAAERLARDTLDGGPRIRELVAAVLED